MDNEIAEGGVREAQGAREAGGENRRGRSSHRLPRPPLVLARGALFG